MSDAIARRGPASRQVSGPLSQGSLARLAQAVDDAAAGDHGTSGQLMAALTLTARLRAEVDLTEARLITKARAVGKTWAEIAAVLRLRSRQAAEQRYVRRTRAGAREDGVMAAVEADPSSPRRTARRSGASDVPDVGTPSVRVVNELLTTSVDQSTDEAGRRPAKLAATRPAARKVSDQRVAGEPVIRKNSQYKLARIGDGCWAVLVDGSKAGTIRRAREPLALRTAVWEPVTWAGVPVRCMPPNATKSGYARTRDAAAIELLSAIVRRQREIRKRHRRARIESPPQEKMQRRRL